MIVVDTVYNTMTGGRIKRIQKNVGDETFMMTYGDGVCDVEIDKLVEFNKSHGKLATFTAAKIIPTTPDEMVARNKSMGNRKRTCRLRLMASTQNRQSITPWRTTSANDIYTQDSEVANNSFFVGCPKADVWFARLMSVFANIQNHKLGLVEYLCDVFRRIKNTADEKLVELFAHKWLSATLSVWCNIDKIVKILANGS